MYGFSVAPIAIGFWHGNRFLTSLRGPTRQSARVV
jgi:hypothetical protein